MKEQKAFVKKVMFGVDGNAKREVGETEKRVSRVWICSPTNQEGQISNSKKTLFGEFSSVHYFLFFNQG